MSPLADFPKLMPKFELGRCVATQASLALIRDCGEEPETFLARHAWGDWGELDDEDKRANERAVKNGSRLLSCYRLARSGCQVVAGHVWVITEADRSATTLSLPSEY